MGGSLHAFLSSGELRNEIPRRLIGMVTALMYLTADACKRRPANAVLTVIITDRQIASAAVVMKHLHAITRYAINGIRPFILIGKGYVKFAFALVVALTVHEL